MPSGSKRSSSSTSGEREAKRKQRNKESSKSANERRRNRIHEANKELTETRDAIDMLEQRISSLREENSYLKSILQKNEAATFYQ